MYIRTNRNMVEDSARYSPIAVQRSGCGLWNVEGGSREVGCGIGEVGGESAERRSRGVRNGCAAKCIGGGI
jgi:hypothetical protein